MSLCTGGASARVWYVPQTIVKAAELVSELAVIVMRDGLASWPPPQPLANLKMLWAQNAGAGDNVQRRSAQTKIKMPQTSPLLLYHYYFSLLIYCVM